MTKEIQPVSPSLPQPKKGMPEWGPDYLEALKKAKGVLYVAAKLVSLTYSAVYKARRVYPELDKAIDEIKAEQDSLALAKLEDISLTQAMKTGCVTERIFRMKAYDHKYREKTIQGPGNINIVMGYQIPPTPGRNFPVGAKIIDAEVEEGAVTRLGVSDILTEDDLDI